MGDREKQNGSCDVEMKVVKGRLMWVTCLPPGGHGDIRARAMLI